VKYVCWGDSNRPRKDKKRAYNFYLIKKRREKKEKVATPIKIDKSIETEKLK
jgi:hypothetical protein